jgi:hypothetical protein
MIQFFNKIQTNYDSLVSIFIPLLFAMTAILVMNQFYSTAKAITNESGSGTENIEIDYSIVPTNISVLPESLPAGSLYLSSILSDGTITYTRNLTDEVFPFQLDRWYQQIQFMPIYKDRNLHTNLTIESLLIGEMQDFDNFDELLSHARLYRDVPLNSTIILDLPNKDVSFMEVEMKFSNGDVGVYFGLYDGNQQTDKSELRSYMNPESNPGSITSVPATEIKSNSLLHNATFTLVCNNLYKLGYDKCVT